MFRIRLSRPSPLFRVVFGLLILVTHLQAEPARSAIPKTPPLGTVIRIYDTGEHEWIDLSMLISRLRSEEMIFLGETHLDETTHRFELALYEGLLRQSDFRCVLALEMFERDVQETIDLYLAGEITEDEFLKSSRPWTNYATDYRPLIELARGLRLPVYASNLPRSLRGRLLREGRSVIDSLSDTERGWFPSEVHPNREAYWDRFERALRGHAGSLLDRSDPESLLYNAQSLWDNTMGESCVRALRAHPGFQVLHLNGAFHTRERMGIVDQVLKRRPETRLKVVDVAPVAELPLAVGKVNPERAKTADFLVYAKSRARSFQQETHAVTVAAEVEYRMSVPKRGEAPPLLIYLPPEGISSAEAERWAQLAFGDEALIVTLEHPFPQREDDLSLGGRWFFSARFERDVARVARALTKILTRLEHTVRFDAGRIVIVGERTGATAVAFAALHGSPLPVQSFAVFPDDYARLRDMALPPPGSREAHFPFPYVDLSVFSDQASVREWWSKELADFADSGVTGAVESARRFPIAPVRAALGLEPLREIDAEPLNLVLRHDSVRARYWARLEILRRQLRGEAVALIPNPAPSQVPAHSTLAFVGEGSAQPAYRAALMQNAAGLPRSPGLFGGATIIVTYPETPPEERRAWDELVAFVPSRFHHYHTVHMGQPGSLVSKFRALRDRGTRDVLIVPAAFCATADEMRALKRAVDDVLTPEFGASFTLHWSPGLGGEIADLLE